MDFTKRRAMHGFCIAVAFFVSGICFLAATSRAEITIGAAISMSGAMEEIAKAYPGKVRLSFAGTNIIARQIEAGAPIDVFVSADTAHMDALVAKGFIEKKTLRAIATNELVVVVPFVGEKKYRLESARSLMFMRRIAIADSTSVPSGMYAKKWLEAEGIWNNIQPEIIPVQNVRAALLAAETGNARAAIVYRSDALSSKKVNIALVADPEKTGAIEYPAALIRASPKKAEALAFLAFLSTEESRKILLSHGFTLPNVP